jgi:hypothetical protein
VNKRHRDERREGKRGREERGSELDGLLAAVDLGEVYLTPASNLGVYHPP